MAQTYFSIGSTLAGLTNIESTYGLIANVLPDARIPLTGGIRRRSLAGVSRADGFINGVLRVDFAAQSELDSFVYAIFGGYTTVSAAKYMSLIDETGHYSSFYGYIDKPSSSVVSGGYLRNIEFQLAALTLQTVTKTTTASLTASERLVYANTAGGGFTATLCAANAVQANTVVSVVKTSATGTLTVARAGSDTINGGTSSLTRTSNYSRIDLVSDGVSAWVTI